MISYGDHLDWMDKQVNRAIAEADLLLAEFQGVKDAYTYPQPVKKYATTQATTRYETGFEIGKAKLLVEGHHARERQIHQCGGVATSQEAGSGSAVNRAAD